MIQTPTAPGSGYPPARGRTDLTAPVPRRIRATLAGQTVLDTLSALYVWEWERYPQYYVPVADLDPAALVDEHREQHLRRGTARRYGLRVGETERPASVRIYGADAHLGLSGYARLEWGAPDAWYEEDERVFVHPRDPYVRVDALRSTRTVRVELDGVVLAESGSPVMVFETALPTRYYVNRSEIDLTVLQASDTVSECPYKGITSAYWSACTPTGIHPDIAWTYDFPTRQLQPITGLVAFYNEKVDVFLDDEVQIRPETHFS